MEDRRAPTPPHPHRTRFRVARARSGSGGDDCLARCAARRRADAGDGRLPGPLRPRRTALARRGHGAVPGSLDERPLECLGGCGAGGGGRSRRRHRRARPRRRVATRQSVVGRVVRSDRVSGARPCHAPAGLVRLQSSGRRPCAHTASGRRARDRAARRLEGGREDPACRAFLRSESSHRDRPSHRGRQRLHRRPGACDRPGDPALPREGERLERHRLQLPRRSLRHPLRGPLRRGRAQRRRGARGGLQHGLRRGGPARRVQLAGGRGEGAQLTCRAARLAPRRRTRRPGDDAVVHLGRQRPLRRRTARVPPDHLRASRHRLHRLPRHRALQPAQRDRRRGRPDRAAQALRADGHRCGPRHGAVPGKAVVAAALDGRRLRRVRQRRRLLARHGRERRLDLGREGGAAGELHVHDPLGPERHACTRRHRRRRRLARNRRALGRPGDGFAERGHDLGQHDDHVHPEHACERCRSRPGRARRPGCDLPEGVEACRRARAPLRPGPAPGRDLPDRARRQRDRQACCDRSRRNWP